METADMPARRAEIYLAMALLQIGRADGAKRNQTRLYPHGKFQPPREGKIGINAEARKHYAMLGETPL